MLWYICLTTFCRDPIPDALVSSGLAVLQIIAYNMAPARTETTIIPITPNPALLTCGTTSPAAAPALPLAPALAVPLLLPLVPLAVELAPPVGVPVAVAVLLLLQKISPGVMPLLIKQLCRSDTLCWTDRQ